MCDSLEWIVTRRAPAWLGVGVVVGLLGVSPTAASGTPADDSSPLIAAVKHRDTEAVRELLATSQDDVNAQEGDGSTALHWAVRRGEDDVAGLLVRAGANPSAANQYGVTPLHLACVNRSATMVDLLLGAEADPNATTASGETVLMSCARTGSADTVAALIRRGATNLFAVEPMYGQDALMWAASGGHAEVVRLLIERGADVTSRSRVREQFVSFGNMQGNAAYGGFTPLLFAARDGSVETAQVLLSHGANVNDTAADGSSVLLVASYSGHRELAAYLLGAGADPNASGPGYTPLHAAVLRGDASLVRVLLDHDAHPDVRLTKGTPIPRDSNQYVLSGTLAGATPFLLAAKFGEVEIMRVLLSQGADPLIPLINGTTALMVAAGMTWGENPPRDRRDRVVPAEVVQALVVNKEALLEPVRLAADAGVDINAANRAGDTALHAAAQKGFGAIVDFLLARGADLDAENARGVTVRALLCGDEARLRRCP